MSATGADTEASNTSTFVSALVVGVITLAVFTIIFLVLHGRSRKVYQPRFELVAPSKRPEELPTSPIAWFTKIARTPDLAVLSANGPDSYFFMRFLLLMVKIFAPWWFLTWTILMPISATGGGGQTGLNMFTFGNIVGAKQNYHVAHLILGVFFFGYILWLLYVEYEHFYTIRQQWLADAEHAASAAARTIIITNVPAKFMSESALTELANGAIKNPIERVWLARKTDTMNELFDTRNAECFKLEAAEGKVQALAYDIELEKRHKEAIAKAKAKAGAEAETEVEPSAVEDADLISRHVPKKDRPTHYSGIFLFSRKVDTLEYSPTFIKEHNDKLEAERAKLSECPLGNSAFLRFTTMADAHTFCQLVTSAANTRLISSTCDVVPEGVVWNNLSMLPHTRWVKIFISWGLTVALIIFWAPIVAFVGVISNINNLANSVSWLGWINSIPTAVQGIIQGILPPVALAILFMLLPIVLRKLIELQGEPLANEIERKLFARFWIFQVIHGFLIITIASGLTDALADIQGQVEQLPTLLATKLPGASIFFLTFIVTTTLASAGKMSARLVPFIMSFITFFRGNTPRKVYKSDFKMASLELSTAWPPIALLGCITIVYAIIQPIIVGFGLLGFGLLYIGYKYNLIWVIDQTDPLETGGIIYNKALTTVFTSLYLAEVCLAGLFFLQRENPDGGGGAAPLGIAGGIIFAICIGITAIFQIWLQRKFSLPKLTYTDAAYIKGTRNILGLPKKTNKIEPATTEEVPPVTAPVDIEELPPSKRPRNEPREVYGTTSGLHDQAFDAPSTWKPQPIIWIAKDQFGISKQEVERLEAAGVTASDEYAQFEINVPKEGKKEKAKIIVDRAPPDEAWHGEEDGGGE